MMSRHIFLYPNTLIYIWYFCWPLCTFARTLIPKSFGWFGKCYLWATEKMSLRYQARSSQGLDPPTVLALLDAHLTCCAGVSVILKVSNSSKSRKIQGRGQAQPGRNQGFNNSMGLCSEHQGGRILPSGF